MSDNNFKYLTEDSKNSGSKNLELIKQKGAYPYEYINSFKRLNEKKLPDKESFYRSTKDGTANDDDDDDDGKKLDGHINDREYLSCKKIWEVFDIKNIGNYYNHYLRKDVLLLDDVSEKFIDTCLKFYGLDLCHFFGSAGLSWDAMLKTTGVKFEKISNIDMYLFIEKGLKGGISYIAKRYAKVNNKYMKNYDPTKPLKFITHLDMNNLYG